MKLQLFGSEIFMLIFLDVIKIALNVGQIIHHYIVLNVQKVFIQIIINVNNVIDNVRHVQLIVIIVLYIIMALNHNNHKDVKFLNTQILMVIVKIVLQNVTYVLIMINVIYVKMVITYKIILVQLVKILVKIA